MLPLAARQTLGPRDDSLVSWVVLAVDGYGMVVLMVDGSRRRCVG